MRALLSASERRRDMHRFAQTTSVDECLEEQAQRLRKEARKLRTELSRELLMQGTAE
jgi:hypothetical protein